MTRTSHISHPTGPPPSSEHTRAKEQRTAKTMAMEAESQLQREFELAGEAKLVGNFIGVPYYVKISALFKNCTNVLKF